MDVTQTNKPWLPGPRKAPPPAVGHLWLPGPKALLTELCLQGAGLTGGHSAGGDQGRWGRSVAPGPLGSSASGAAQLAAGVIGCFWIHDVP